MKFLKLFNNRVLRKFCFWALLGLLICLVGISKPKADIVQYKFIDYESTSATMKQTSYVAYEDYTYPRDYVLFNGNDKFFAFNYCATGPFDFSFPNDFEGVTQLVGYSQGGHCYVQGYEGYNYTMYFMAKQIHDAGNGNSSIMFNTYMKNRNGYNVLINVLSLTSVASIPAGVQIPTYDGEFSTLNTKIDTVEQAVEEVKRVQNENLNEQKKTNDTLTDETAPDTPDFKDIDISSDTPVSDLILMPINYLNKLINVFSGTCSDYVLDFGIFNSDYKLTLPCIKGEKYLGANLWKIIDMFICFFMCFNIGMLAVTIFNDWTSLRDTYDSLYEPKHVYRPKHGGGD